MEQDLLTDQTPGARAAAPSRRNVIRAGTVAVVGAGAVGSLAACGGGSSGGTASSAGTTTSAAASTTADSGGNASALAKLSDIPVGQAVSATAAGMTVILPG